MRVRRGGQAGSEGGTPVEDFREWWVSAGRAAAEAGIGGAGFESFTGEMTTRVQAVHPGLAWELAPGARAEHALIVTVGGVPGPRRLAERWYRHAHAARHLTAAGIEVLTPLSSFACVAGLMSCSAHTPIQRLHPAPGTPGSPCAT